MLACRIRGLSSPSGDRRRHRRRREKSPSVAAIARGSFATPLTGAATRRGSVTYSASGEWTPNGRVAAALLLEVLRTPPYDISADALCEENGVCHCDRHDRDLVGRDRIWNERQRGTRASRARVDAAARWRAPRLRGFRPATLAEKAVSGHGLTTAPAAGTRVDARASAGPRRSPRHPQNSVGSSRRVVG